MRDLVCAAEFDNHMEAELVKNSLEAQHIPASIILDESDSRFPVKLYVRAEDQDAAQAFMNPAEGEGSVTDAEEAAEAAAADEEARKEFQAIHHQELQQKAAGVRKSFIILGCAVSAGVLILVLGPRTSLMNRLALGCFLYALIELFIGLDALKAARKLQESSDS